LPIASTASSRDSSGTAAAFAPRWKVSFEIDATTSGFLVALLQACALSGMRRERTARGRAAKRRKLRPQCGMPVKSTSLHFLRDAQAASEHARDHVPA